MSRYYTGTRGKAAGQNDMRCMNVRSSRGRSFTARMSETPGIPPDARAIVSVGVENAKPAPGVLEAIAEADVIVFPPSNPVVSIGTILEIPGIRQAVADAAAPVVGLSPIVGGGPVRGMADKVLAAVGVEVSAAAVAKHYGAELLDGWLVDADTDAAAVAEVEAAGIACRAVPLPCWSMGHRLA